MPPVRRRRWRSRLLIGGRVFAAMKRSLGVGEWIRRGLGVAVLAGVAAIALGLDTGFLTQASLASTAGLEQGLLDKFGKRGRPPGSDRRPVAMPGDAGMMMAAECRWPTPTAAACPSRAACRRSTARSSG